MNNPNYTELIVFLVYFIGFIIHAIILRSLLRSAFKSSRETFLTLLIMSLTLYFGGLFTGYLLSVAFGDLLDPVSNWFLLIGFVALSLTPPFLLGTTVLFKDTSAEFFQRSLLHKLLLLLLFGPTLIMWFKALPMAQITPNPSLNPFLGLGIDYLVKPFSLWFVVCLSISALLSYKYQGKSIDISEKRFLQAITAVFLFVAFLILVVQIVEINYSGEGIAKWINLISVTSAILPTLILGYFIYRFQYLELIIRPGLVYTLITGFILTVYLIGIRSAGRYLSATYEIESSFFEGILLAILILLTQPLKNKLHKITTYIFFRERVIYQQLINTVTYEISGLFDMREIMSKLRSNLLNVIGLEKVGIIQWNGGIDGVRLYPKSEFDLFSITDTLNYLKRSGKAFSSDSMLNTELRNESLSEKISYFVPLKSGDSIFGALLIGKKRNGDKLSNEEKSMLQTIGNQTALAMENATLFQQRLDLERKMVEAEKLASIGLLTATVTHEIKNPLSSISVIVQNMLLEKENKSSKDLILIDKEMKRLRNVVNSLLAYSKPNTNANASTGISEAIEEVCLLVRSEASLKNVQLLYEKNMPTFIADCGKTEFKEILLNLMLNAVESIEKEGMVRINVSAIPDNDYISISISDTGKGIDANKLEKIYEPFYTTKTEGTGLGMSIVKRRLDDIGGSIDIQSVTGGGTEVTFTVPASNKLSSTTNEDK